MPIARVDVRGGLTAFANTRLRCSFVICRQSSSRHSRRIGRNWGRAVSDRVEADVRLHVQIAGQIRADGGAAKCPTLLRALEGDAILLGH
jgi:hypothetical protein